MSSIPRPDRAGSSGRRPVASLYLESRYRKLSRELPQTIFYCPDCKGHRHRRRGCERCGGFGKLTKDSVQELLARRILPAYRARSGKFHGAGREDIDVLMLGRGRPFVFEVVGPRRFDVDLDEVLDRLHREEGERVRCAPFCPVSRARVAELKEARFDKVYRVVVALSGEPTADPGGLTSRGFDVVQRTPQRVAHRRADLRRERRVTVQSVERTGEVGLELHILCAHGTYVKEWIDGDGGRTTPSLSELLGVSARCLELDVLEIVTAS